MRRRHQRLLALLFTANLGVALTFAGLALAHQALPAPAFIAVDAPLAPALGNATSNPAGEHLVTAPTAGTPPPRAPAASQDPTGTPRPASTTPADRPSTATAFPTALPDLWPSASTGLPASAQVDGVVGRRQSLPLSCEARSAADWAAFFGVNIEELDFLRQLPVSDDPDRGFVGDVRGSWGQVPPAAYGVHAGPVARLLHAYGVRAEARRYIDWEVVQAELAAGRPVIAWVTGHVEPGVSEIYTAADGRQTVVARFEHTVILVGYSAGSVSVVDGARRYETPLAQFLESWAVLRNMAITYDG